jgi:hypothetical protein
VQIVTVFDLVGTELRADLYWVKNVRLVFTRKKQLA